MAINAGRFFSGPHSSCAVIGAQWGDEGKGKIVDVLSDKADVVVRYQGGDNAGHTVVSDGTKTVLHVLPSGAIRGKKCVLGRGMVINPSALLEDIEAVGDEIGDVLVDTTAPVITPYHIALDEPEDGGDIGTTSRGIGPTYASFVAREGLRFSDFFRGKKEVHNKMKDLHDHVEDLGEMPDDILDSIGVTDDLWGAFNELEDKVEFVDVGEELRADLRDRDTKVLFEGAQGTMLDVGFGNYPYVTSSHPTSGGISPGTGVPPSMIDRVVGVTKAYTTRVGNGTFPAGHCTHHEVKHRLRKKGNEFGATTGRPRKCGWLDLPALRFACEVNGFDDLVMTKIDVLSGEPDVSLLDRYELRGGEMLETHSPARFHEVMSPKTTEYEGWSEDITDVRAFSDLPEEAQAFVSEINDSVRPSINVLSVGPDREATFTW